jgi:hypothetical protein
MKYIYIHAKSICNRSCSLKRSETITFYHLVKISILFEGTVFRFLTTPLSGPDQKETIAMWICTDLIKLLFSFWFIIFFRKCCNHLINTSIWPPRHWSLVTSHIISFPLNKIEKTLQIKLELGFVFPPRCGQAHFSPRCRAVFLQWGFSVTSSDNSKTSHSTGTGCSALCRDSHRSFSHSRKKLQIIKA